MAANFQRNKVNLLLPQFATIKATFIRIGFAAAYITPPYSIGQLTINKHATLLNRHDLWTALVKATQKRYEIRAWSGVK